jgi:hypothetical protein
LAKSSKSDKLLQILPLIGVVNLLEVAFCCAAISVEKEASLSEITSGDIVSGLDPSELVEIHRSLRQQGTC